MRIISIFITVLLVSCTPTLIPLEVELAEDVVENVAEDIQKHESKK